MADVRAEMARVASGPSEDEVDAGNVRRLDHRDGTSGFSRVFGVEAGRNRASRVRIGELDVDYTFDANGNIRSETTSRHFEWDHLDQMKTFRTQTAGSEPSVHAHYLYDAAGARVKKLVRKQGGDVEVTHYVDGVFEHHRWRTGQNCQVHIADGEERMARVRIGAAHPDDRGPAVQFSLADHLGSSTVVTDAAGDLVVLCVDRTAEVWEELESRRSSAREGESRVGGHAVPLDG